MSVAPDQLDIEVAEPMVSGPLTVYDPRTDELSLGVPSTPAQNKALPWLILGAVAVGVIMLTQGDT